MSATEGFFKNTIAVKLRDHSASYDGDAFWILTSGFLVFFMHAGFAMLEAGSVADKNKVNILYKNVGTVVFGGMAYFLFGYGFALGEAGNNSFIGHSLFATKGFAQTILDGESNNRRDFFFQFAFCVTAATITSGAVAGRIKLEAYLAIATFLTAFVYPVIANWAWSPTGWLSAFKSDSDVSVYIFSDDYEHACGVFDYAGSGVVHLTGGVSAFWSAYLLGPRINRFKDGLVTDMPGHNLSICTLGTFILWFGWYGFNCGSALAFDGTNVAKVAVTTSLAPAAACITGIAFQKFRTGTYDLPSALNCILAGLVAITAGCSTVSDWAAIAIGAIGAVIYLKAADLLIYLKIDDPIGAIPVHGACGIWGVLAVGIFATPQFVATAYSCPSPPEPSPSGDWLDVLPGYQMLQQFLLVICIIAWVSITMGSFVFALSKLKVLRVTEDEELEGLDYHEHGITTEEDPLAGNKEMHAKEVTEQPGEVGEEEVDQVVDEIDQEQPIEVKGEHLPEAGIIDDDDEGGNTGAPSSVTLAGSPRHVEKDI